MFKSFVLTRTIITTKPATVVSIVIRIEFTRKFIFHISCNFFTRVEYSLRNNWL